MYAFFPKLGDMARRRAGSLSGGEQQMLTVARTLMGNPPTPAAQTSPRRGWRAGPSSGRSGSRSPPSKREGLAVVLSEQNLKVPAARLADRAYIIERRRGSGFGGAMADLPADEALRRAYLSM